MSRYTIIITSKDNQRLHFRTNNKILIKFMYDCSTRSLNVPVAKNLSIDEMMIAFGPEAVYHFCICNAWKYKNRAPYKGNFEEDMKKADWYLTKAKEIKGGNLWQE